MSFNQQNSSNIESKHIKISSYIKELFFLLDQFKNIKNDSKKFELSEKIIVCQILKQRKEAAEKILRNYLLYKKRKAFAQKKNLLIQKIINTRKISCIKIQRKWRNFEIKNLVQNEKSNYILWINTIYPNELKIKIYFEDGTNSIKQMSYCHFRKFFYFYIPKSKNKNERKKIRFQFLCKDKIYYNKIYSKIQLNGEQIQEVIFGEKIFEIEKPNIITPTKTIASISYSRKGSVSTINSDYFEECGLNFDNDNFCNFMSHNKIMSDDDNFNSSRKFVRRSKKTATCILSKNPLLTSILKERNPNRRKTITGQKMVKFGDVVFSY